MKLCIKIYKTKNCEHEVQYLDLLNKHILISIS